MKISGHCDTAFQAVADAFQHNFSACNEVGACVTVSVHGRRVVDLWGGVRDPATGQPWEQNTLAVVFSCTKAATALCAQLLIDRGLLELDAPVSRYWPEFAANGKESATVRMMLNHSVGVPAFREPLELGAYYDWDGMVQRVADERPFWEPGSQCGYHMISFGWTVGELVRRVSGLSLGEFFHREIAGPLGLDFYIGLPESEEFRVAPVTPYRPGPGDKLSDFTMALIDKSSVQWLALLNSGRHDINSREAHAAEIGGGGGITNARSLMKMYEPLAAPERSDLPQLMSAERIDDMRTLSMESAQDAVLLTQTRFGQGFMLPVDNQTNADTQGTFSIPDGAFGHVGMGGSVGFADPQSGLAMGYVMNHMGSGIYLNERGQSLVDAVYHSLQ